MNREERRLIELLDRRSLNEVVESGASVLVGISGGADSVALLRAFKIFAPSREVKISAVHVNHGLRPESDSEAAFVTRLCTAFEIPLHCEKLALDEKPGGQSPEEYWREERYKVFRRALNIFSADYIALGQTADDLAETFLYHLVRGTGPEGLTFQFYSASSTEQLPIIRPLWKTRRTAIEAALQGVNQQWIIDPSNFNLQLSRNRLRHEVIPSLEKINPAAVAAIVGLSEKLGDVLKRVSTESALQTQVFEIYPKLQELPYPALRDKIRDFVSGSLQVRHSARNIDQAAAMIKENKSGTVALPGTMTLVITQTMMWLYQGAEPGEWDLAREHAKQFGDFVADISAPRHLDGSRETDIAGFDGINYQIRSSEPGLYIRTRKSGDRVGSRSLKKLLIDYNVPWYLRPYLVLAATETGQVVDIIIQNDALKRWIKHHAVLRCDLQYAIKSPSA